jgi:translation initiation factor IF-1
MSKEDLIELQGIVIEVLAGGNYKVKCGENHEVLARLNGKMRQFRIRVIGGDRVTVGVSPYDLKRGLITYHFNTKDALWRAASEWLFSKASVELAAAERYAAAVDPFGMPL